MAFNLSPSVEFTEEDLTQFVSGTSSSTGGLVGDFSWGPIEEVVRLSSEEQLVSRFYQPDAKNFKDWFTAANFLSYAADLKLVRCSDATDSAINARMLGSQLSASVGTGARLIKNKTEFDSTEYSDENSLTRFGTPFIAKYAGAYGNRLSVAYAQSTEFASWAFKSAFSQAPTGYEIAVVILLDNSTVETFLVSTKSGFKDGYGQNNFMDDVINLQSEYVYAFSSNLTKIAEPWYFTSVGADGTILGLVSGDDGGPNSVVQLTAGSTSIALAITSGVAQFDLDVVGTKFKVLSGANKGEVFVVTASSLTGNTHTLILDHAPVTSQALNFNTAGTPTAIEENRFTPSTGNGDNIGSIENFEEGVDVGAIVAADVIQGWGLMDSAEEIDVSLLMEGAGDSAKLIANHLVSNVAEVRKDAVAFISPISTDVIGSATPVTSLIATRNLLPSSTYAFFDGNYKYQYDRYNDTFRWVPFNGDIAGLAARTDQTNDSWWSFAGYNRGILKNVTKVAFANSKKSQRDDLYQSQINPIIQEAGSGTLLLGDKTMQVKDSAFSFINVRRLFIALEKAITNAAKFNLFEFNDEFTRNRFVQLVTPFLRDVQGRRGITEFSVIADTSVNTPQVINSGEFRSTILIKPNRSINFIHLTFTAVAEGVEFDEII